MKERKPTARELHEQQRKELWMKVVVAVASSSNANNSSSMISWADHALAKFDQRFGLDSKT